MFLGSFQSTFTSLASSDACGVSTGGPPKAAAVGGLRYEWNESGRILMVIYVTNPQRFTWDKYPYAPCLEYLPTFTPKITQM